MVPLCSLRVSCSWILLSALVPTHPQSISRMTFLKLYSRIFQCSCFITDSIATLFNPFFYIYYFLYFFQITIFSIIYCLFIIAVHLPQHSINPVLCRTTIWTLICQSIKSYGNPRALVNHQYKNRVQISVYL